MGWYRLKGPPIGFRVEGYEIFYFVILGMGVMVYIILFRGDIWLSG